MARPVRSKKRSKVKAPTRKPTRKATAKKSTARKVANNHKTHAVTASQIDMSAAEFNQWIKAKGFSHSEAAKRLGIARGSLIKYTQEGAPLTVRLACDGLRGRSRAVAR